MADIAYVAISIGFFALSTAFVRGLDRMIRSDELDEVVPAEAAIERKEVLT